MDIRKKEKIIEVGIVLIAVLLVGSVIGIMAYIGEDTRQSILIMLAQSASGIELAIGIMGISLILVALLIYQPQQDYVLYRLDRIDGQITKWMEQYEQFYNYVCSAKMLQKHLSTLIFQSQQEGDEKCWEELKDSIKKYNSELREAHDRLEPLDQTMHQIVPALRRSIESDYEKSLTMCLILASVGLTMLLLAIILPGTDSMLGMVAGQMVDPSLQGEDRINEIMKLKDMLRSL